MIGGRAVKQRTSEIRAAIAAGDDSAAERARNEEEARLRQHWDDLAREMNLLPHPDPVREHLQRHRCAPDEIAAIWHKPVEAGNAR
jgi:hypothetical protein